MDQQTGLSLEALHARMLKKQLWIVMSKAVKPPEEVRKHLKAHIEHQIRLEKNGIMYGAGPVSRAGRCRGLQRPAPDTVRSGRGWGTATPLMAGGAERSSANRQLRTQWPRRTLQ